MGYFHGWRGSRRVRVKRKLGIVFRLRFRLMTMTMMLLMLTIQFTQCGWCIDDDDYDVVTQYGRCIKA